VSGSFDVSDPDWITVGTVGEPGRRVFYLQLAGAGTVVTLKVEKIQVAQLAELLTEILSDLPAPSGQANGISVPNTDRIGD